MALPKQLADAATRSKESEYPISARTALKDRV